MLDWQGILEEAVRACGSQAELARRLKRTLSAVGNWRMGRFRPDYESCLRIATITGHSAFEVVTAAGHDRGLLQVAMAVDAGKPNESADKVDPDLAAVTAAWPNLDDGIRRAIRILVLNAAMAVLIKLNSAPADPSYPLASAA